MQMLDYLKALSWQKALPLFLAENLLMLRAAHEQLRTP